MPTGQREPHGVCPMAEGLVDWGGEPRVSGGAHNIGAPLWDETHILGKSWALPLTHPQRRIGAVPGGRWVQGIPGGVAAPILGGMGVRLVLLRGCCAGDTGGCSGCCARDSQPGQGWETTPPEWELLSQLGVMISEVELS